MFYKRSSKAKALNSDVSHAFNYMIALLTRREYSAHELKTKCAQRYTKDAIEQAFDRCIELNYQSDERYAQMLVAHMESSLYGLAKLKVECLKKGLDWDIVEPFADNIDWQKLAYLALLKKYKDLTLLDYEGKRKALAFLARRGFTLDIGITAFEQLLAEQKQQEEN